MFLAVLIFEVAAILLTLTALYTVLVIYCIAAMKRI